ncbi:hypothetical protein HZH68_002867 [Vespula germanica]|uniref:Uncharacterized protein n=2 Tax=Vespula TaxID=7451 RepID=A0A834NN23_VESGE|nr:hypothetical protein HZH66_002247 [Vespula vulgaris]KAF7414378.1 hypothetical protein HZH68_002867 [Vespula germanica]
MESVVGLHNMEAPTAFTRLPPTIIPPLSTSSHTEGRKKDVERPWKGGKSELVKRIPLGNAWDMGKEEMGRVWISYEEGRAETPETSRLWLERGEGAESCSETYSLSSF